MGLIARHGFRLAKRNCFDNFFSRRFASSQADSPSADEDKLYRTNQNIVRLQNQDQIGQFFTVDPKIVEVFGQESRNIGHNYLAPLEWSDRNKIFGESCIMVRKPALEIINCLKQTDYEKPAIRYVLYGKDGCGKSLTLSHVQCYGYQENFVVLKFGWIKHWLTRYHEVAPSTFKPGRIDHISNSNAFLIHFRRANSDRLDKCVTHRDYTWSARDKIKAGSKLSEVVDLGCDRLNFAADALNVLLRELKLNSNEGNCKVMMLLDGVNSLFADHTMIHKEKRRLEPGPYSTNSDWMSNVAQVDECSVLVNILKMLKNDWKNAAIITTVDPGAEVKKMHGRARWWRSKVLNMKIDTESHLPFACLGEKGWSMLNPFFPVWVDKYSVDEMDSALDYYIDKSWVRQECAKHNRRQELHFVTGRIPQDLFKFSAYY